MELAIVIIVISLVTAMGFVFGKEAIETARRVQTQNKLDEIEKALLRFRTMNDRLPCPGNPTLATSHASYGSELLGSSEPCSTNNTTTPPFRFANTNVSPEAIIVAGNVPVRTLGLPDDFMYDGWGRKFEYAIDQELAAARAFKFIPPMANDCAIPVSNGPTGLPAIRSSGAIYVLVSAGPNGHGGYTKAGTRHSSGSTNSYEQANCHCNSSATSTNPGANQKYVLREQVGSTGTAGFDDIVRYKERWQMMNDEDRKLNASSSEYMVGVTYNSSFAVNFSKLGCHGWVSASAMARVSFPSAAGGTSAAISRDKKILMAYVNDTNDCQPYIMNKNGGDVTAATCSPMTACVPTDSCPAYTDGSKVVISDNDYMAISTTASPYIHFSRLSGTDTAIPYAAPLMNAIPNYTLKDHRLTARPTIMAFSKNADFFFASDGTTYGTMYVRRGNQFLQVTEQPLASVADRTVVTCNGLWVGSDCADLDAAIFSPNGKYFAVSYVDSGPTPLVKIWKITKGTPLVTYGVTGYVSTFTDTSEPGVLGLADTVGPLIAFSQDGQYFAAAAASATSGNDITNVSVYRIGDDDSFTPINIDSTIYPNLNFQVNTSANMVFSADSNWLFVPVTYDDSGLSTTYGLAVFKRTAVDTFAFLPSSELVDNAFYDDTNYVTSVMWLQ